MNSYLALFIHLFSFFYDKVIVFRSKSDLKQEEKKLMLNKMYSMSTTWLSKLRYHSPKPSLRTLDHYMFLGNCPPTPPLSHYFALSEK